jgi:hypothetical protein
MCLAEQPMVIYKWWWWWWWRWCKYKIICLGCRIWFSHNSDYERTVFRVVKLCRLERDRRFGGTYSLHLQGGRISQVLKQQNLRRSAADDQLSLPPTSMIIKFIQLSSVLFCLLVCRGRFRLLVMLLPVNAISASVLSRKQVLFIPIIIYMLALCYQLVHEAESFLRSCKSLM